MEQLKFIGRRLVYLVVMLLGVATLVFILTKLIPGDPTVANLSQRALSDPEIVAAIADPPAFKYDLDASRGAEGFKPVKIDYKRDFHSFSDGVLRLNNDDPKMSYATCSLNDNALLLAGKGVLVVEWVVEAGVPAKADENSFQMVIRPATGKEGMIYPGIFKFAAGRVITPWRTIVTPKTGFLTCRFLINLANGNAVFQLNGETVAEGNLAEFKDKPAFFFGDGSIWISGSAAIKSLKVGLQEAR